MLRSIGPMELIVVVLTIGIAALMAIPFCRISRRLGYSSAWGLITILPLGALAWSCYVAFQKWPIESSPH